MPATSIYTMKFILLLGLFLLALACKPGVTAEQQPVEHALSAYSAAPSDSTASALSLAVAAFVALKGPQDSISARYLLTAARAEAAEENLDEAARHYRTWLIASPARPDARDKAAEAIQALAPLATAQVQQAMFRAFTGRYPEDKRSADWRGRITDSAVDLDALLVKLKTDMVDTITFRLDEAKAKEYIQASELVVMIDPTLASGPENLHLAGETARTIRQPAKAIEIFDWLANQYPEHPRGQTGLFLKGFVTDSDLKDYKRAGEIYNLFIARYPTHEFAESARFLLANLGKSDDEIIRMLEEKQKPGREQ